MSAGAIKPGAGSRPGIVGVGETPMLRHPEPGCSTAGLLARAIGLALADAGVAPGEVDGLAWPRSACGRTAPSTWAGGWA